MTVSFTSKLKDCFLRPEVSTLTLLAVIEPLLAEAYGEKSVPDYLDILRDPPKRHWGEIRYDDVLQELSWSMRDKVVADSYYTTVKQVVNQLEALCEPGTLRATWSSQTLPGVADYPKAERGVLGKERGAGVAVASPTETSTIDAEEAETMGMHG